MSTLKRRFPIGAEPMAEGGTHFRVWAPARERVSVVERQLASKAPGRSALLEREPNGYHSGLVEWLKPGALYGFQLDSDEASYPDPASRFQPEGPHGPSQIVEPHAFRWHDQEFKGFRRGPHAIYECHVGTFTKAGTYCAATEQLSELAELGITLLELMPLGDFPGRFGWGYDGVNLFAPTRLYGTPDELRTLVDRAHALGMCVILDVVYNHVGPIGNYLGQFSRDYVSRRHKSEWGDPINFDGENAGPVREFFVQNARYWIEEFHFDGLRLDATQSIIDCSPEHVIGELTQAARDAGEALGKQIFVVSENEPQQSSLVRPRAAGGQGNDALWNDDFHHSAHVALTGQREAYYSDYRGTAQELLSGLKWGYLFQGQHYFWQQQCRGEPALDLGASAFVTYLQNHDQVANSATGARAHTLSDAGTLRALTALLLLSPPTPMLFQGQEFAASAPFLFFADLEDPERAKQVNESRAEFLAQFPSIADEQVRARLVDIADPATFERCKLDLAERVTHSAVYTFHRDLLSLRKRDPAFSACDARSMHGAVLGERTLVLRFFCAQGDRLLICNLADDLDLKPAPEPLLAPPSGCGWAKLLSTDDPRYGGTGAGQVWKDGVWHLPARSTQVLEARATPPAEPDASKEKL
ncbi:MAG TPA: malto-oligosyltrehalose trehalohydrolase [Polyangiaceae bacterium]|nr:malto-oligosyltrehalose trehalohydrolase [Polyangiaceae bacterium]